MRSSHSARERRDPDLVLFASQANWKDGVSPTKNSFGTITVHLLLPSDILDSEGTPATD